MRVFCWKMKKKKKQTKWNGEYDLNDPIFSHSRLSSSTSTDKWFGHFTKHIFSSDFRSNIITISYLMELYAKYIELLAKLICNIAKVCFSAFVAISIETIKCTPIFRRREKYLNQCSIYTLLAYYSIIANEKFLFDFGLNSAWNALCQRKADEPKPEQSFISFGSDK